jgi:uncharacterized Zn finger protein (UPF0148 family)
MTDEITPELAAKLEKTPGLAALIAEQNPGLKLPVSTFAPTITCMSDGCNELGTKEFTKDGSWHCPACYKKILTAVTMQDATARVPQGVPAPSRELIAQTLATEETNKALLNGREIVGHISAREMMNAAHLRPGSTMELAGLTLFRQDPATFLVLRPANGPADGK